MNEGNSEIRKLLAFWSSRALQRAVVKRGRSHKKKSEPCRFHVCRKHQQESIFSAEQQTGGLPLARTCLFFNESYVFLAITPERLSPRPPTSSRVRTKTETHFWIRLVFRRRPKFFKATMQIFIGAYFPSFGGWRSASVFNLPLCRLRSGCNMPVLDLCSTSANRSRAGGFRNFCITNNKWRKEF